MMRDRPLAKQREAKPAPEPRKWFTMIVGNHTGELILSSGRNLGKIDAGEVVLVTEEERSDPKLVPVTQASLRAVRAFR
jgi:hypothetical protein